MGSTARGTSRKVTGGMKKLVFPEPFRHDHPSVEVPYDAYRKRHTIGQKAAEAVAGTVGSWTYIVIQSAVVALWCTFNVIAWSRRWDPYPFIFLNLIFSIASAYTAPLIMMSQNRQDEIDRIEAHNDHLINQKVEKELHVIMDHLDAQNTALEIIFEKIDSLHEEKEG
jgi:uncharacterized membrane protein